MKRIGRVYINHVRSLKIHSGEHLLYKFRERIYNLKWVFHKMDEDFWPSVPHGHALEKKYKLDVNNGIVYDEISHAKLGKASAKELTKLHKDKEFQAFALTHINWYNDNHPYNRRPIPEWLSASGLMLNIRDFDRIEETLYRTLKVRITKQH